MHNAVVHAGDWELRVRAGPMLRSAETRSLCASWFAPRRPWCVAGPGPPADCPCGALDLCGVAAHVPEAVHGRSFVEAVHAPTGARVAFRCRVAETREWRLRLTRLRLSLQSDALDAGTGGGSAALFALGYTFTSGSTGQSSRESNRRSPRTHLLPTSATGSGALELKEASDGA